MNNRTSSLHDSDSSTRSRGSSITWGFRRYSLGTACIQRSFVAPVPTRSSFKCNLISLVIPGRFLQDASSEWPASAHTSDLAVDLWSISQTLNMHLKIQTPYHSSYQSSQYPFFRQSIRLPPASAHTSATQSRNRSVPKSATSLLATQSPFFFS
jgi:hypothetical protein